jgi:hypothetical protein
MSLYHYSNPCMIFTWCLVAKVRFLRAQLPGQTDFCSHSCLHQQVYWRILTDKEDELEAWPADAESSDSVSALIRLLSSDRQPRSDGMATNERDAVCRLSLEGVVASGPLTAVVSIHGNSSLHLRTQCSSDYGEQTSNALTSSAFSLRTNGHLPEANTVRSSLHLCEAS